MLRCLTLGHVTGWSKHAILAGQNERMIANLDRASSRARAARPAVQPAHGARSRRDPVFYVVDHDLNVASASIRPKDDLAWHGALPPDVHEAVKQLLDGATLSTGTLVATLGRDKVLRLVPTVGQSQYYVIFIEPFRSRDVLGAASNRYHFSARELDVLKLLFRGESTDDIASALCISNFTVQQHVKNIGRRMGLSTRKEIVATLLGIR
jgi:DNA-binding NarL/FixJ family response regulator